LVGGGGEIIMAPVNFVSKKARAHTQARGMS
jgi:hypothetical protein